MGCGHMTKFIQQLHSIVVVVVVVVGVGVVRVGVGVNFVDWFTAQYMDNVK